MQFGQLEISLLEDDLWSIYSGIPAHKPESFGTGVEHRRLTSVTLIRRFRPILNQIPQTPHHSYPVTTIAPTGAVPFHCPNSW
jgi:hypothetical protein